MIGPSMPRLLLVLTHRDIQEVDSALLNRLLAELAKHDVAAEIFQVAPFTAFDFRVGGRWQIRTDIPNGPTVVFQGEFREIVAPEKIVRTFGMEGMWEGRYAVETVMLIADGPRTIYRATSRFASRADFEGMIASGMEKGMNEGFERLDELLAELSRHAA